MALKPPPLPDLAEALRLVRAGRIADATTILQGRLASAGETPDPSEQRAGAGPSDTPLLRSIPKRMREYFERSDRARFAGQPDVARRPPPPSAPQIGHVLSETFSNAAGQRPYRLFIPSRYHGQPVPLIVMLHGCTQSARDFALGTRMDEIAEDEVCLVAYPEQISAANAQKCWNWFKPSDQGRDAGEPSLIAGITRSVMDSYQIDAERVYVAGLSAGGAAAAIMGATYPDLYTAIGIHSGLPAGSATDLPSALMAMKQGGLAGSQASSARPTIVFHGDADITVNPRNAETLIGQGFDRGTLTKSTESGRITGGHLYTRTRYSNGAGTAMLEQWTVHGGGHAWSGGSTAGSFTDPAGPDASRAMMSFFLSHRSARS